VTQRVLWRRGEQPRVAIADLAPLIAEQLEGTKSNRV